MESPIKPGFKTTEWYLVLIGKLGALILTGMILSGHITSNDAQGFINVVLASVALISSAIADVGYIQGRTDVKTAAIESSSQ